MNVLRFRRLALVSAVCLSALQPAWAQTYPSKPIRFIIPFAPGGATDIMARMVGQKLTEAWGQPVLVVPAAAPQNTVKDLVDAAKARPGGMNFSAGTATVHLAGELFKLVTGTDIAAVPYKGTTPGLMAVISGEVNFTFEPTVTAVPQVKGGRVRALAVTSPKRSPLLPAVPTTAEAGLPAFEAYSWLGIVMPAGVPKDVATKLQNEVLRILDLPDVKEKMAATGLDPLPMNGERFTAFIKTETDKWARTIKASGMKIE